MSYPQYFFFTPRSRWTGRAWWTWRSRTHYSLIDRVVVFPLITVCWTDMLYQKSENLRKTSSAWPKSDPVEILKSLIVGSLSTVKILKQATVKLWTFLWGGDHFPPLSREKFITVRCYEDCWLYTPSTERTAGVWNRHWWGQNFCIVVKLHGDAKSIMFRHEVSTCVWEYQK